MKFFFVKTVQANWEGERFYSVALQPKLDLGRLVLRSVVSTQLATHVKWDSYKRVISSSRRPLPTQHTTNTREKHPCSQQDSNPRSYQLEGGGPQTYALDRTATRIGELKTNSIRS